MKYFAGYSSLSHSNKIAVPRAGITAFPVQMVTSGISHRFKRHGLQIAQSIATSIISSGKSVFGASVQRSNLEIMSLLTSNTPGGITTCIEGSAMPTPGQPIQNSGRNMSIEDATCFNIFTVS